MYINSVFSIANSLGILTTVCNKALGETWEVGDPVVAISLGKLGIGADNSPEPFGIVDRITEMHINGVGIGVEAGSGISHNFGFIRAVRLGLPRCRLTMV